MASRPEVFRPVDVQGAMRLNTPDGRTLDLMADGDTLRVELPGWQEARAIMTLSSGGRRQSLRFLANLFATHGLTLSLESAGKPVFRLGRDTAPSWLARLLGLAPAYIPVSAIAILFRR